LPANSRAVRQATRFLSELLAPVVSKVASGLSVPRGAQCRCCSSAPSRTGGAALSRPPATRWARMRRPTSASVISCSAVRWSALDGSPRLLVVLVRTFVPWAVSLRPLPVTIVVRTSYSCCNTKIVLGDLVPNNSVTVYTFSCTWLGRILIAAGSEGEACVFRVTICSCSPTAATISVGHPGDSGPGRLDHDKPDS
jgi:hypothetical protein